VNEKHDRQQEEPMTNLAKYKQKLRDNSKGKGNPAVLKTSVQETMSKLQE